MCILLAGCGKPSETPPPAAADAGGAADVTVTLDGVHHECVVTLAHEQHGSTIACSDIGAFLKDELRLSAGATYDLQTTPPVSAEELSTLKQGLNTAGYRMMGGR
jgi:hypothetical protein